MQIREQFSKKSPRKRAWFQGYFAAGLFAMCLGGACLATVCLVTVCSASAAYAAGAKLTGGAVVVNGKRFKASTPYRFVVQAKRSIIAIRDAGEQLESPLGPVDAGLVVSVDPTNGTEKVLLRGKLTEDTESTLLDLQGLAVSPSGDQVYVFARSVWPSMGAVWSMRPDGSGAKFLAQAGIAPGVVQSGPWKGHLLTTQQLHFSEGGSWFPPVLLDPSTAQVAGVCRRAEKDQHSLVAEMVPFVPMKGLKTVPLVKIGRDE